jgi:hypothetical protein
MLPCLLRLLLLLLQTGVLGGLQVWDTRRGAKPVSRSSLAWGHTGCRQLDKQQGPARQVRSLLGFAASSCYCLWMRC